jgi:hypothetical protein
MLPSSSGYTVKASHLLSEGKEKGPLQAQNRHILLSNIPFTWGLGSKGYFLTTLKMVRILLFLMKTILCPWKESSILPIPLPTHNKNRFLVGCN